MSFDELYPILKQQATYATLRYEEKERKKDKVQELIAMSFEKYQRDVAAGKEIKKQNFKCFITQRAKQVDTRSVVKKGYGGTSTMDVLGFYRRRPDSSTPVVEFAEWMTSKSRGKQMVEDTVSFNIDFQNLQNKLTRIERKILRLLIDGYSATKISEKLKLTYITVKDIINRMKTAFIQYFHIANNKPLAALG